MIATRPECGTGYGIRYHLAKDEPSATCAPTTSWTADSSARHAPSPATPPPKNAPCGKPSTHSLRCSTSTTPPSAPNPRPRRSPRSPRNARDPRRQQAQLPGLHSLRHRPPGQDRPPKLGHVPRLPRRRARRVMTARAPMTSPFPVSATSNPLSASWLRRSGASSITHTTRRRSSPASQTSSSSAATASSSAS